MTHTRFAKGVDGLIPRRISRAYSLMVLASRNCATVTHGLDTPDVHRREFRLAIGQTRSAIKLLSSCTGMDSTPEERFAEAASTAARNALIALSDLQRVPRYLGVIDNDGAFGDQRLDVRHAARALNAAVHVLGETTC